MNSRTPFFFLVFALIIVGLSSIYYRHVEGGVPLTSGEQIDIWQVEATIEFTSNGEPVNARFTLPQDPNYQLVDELTLPPGGYGVHLLREENQAEVIWSKREAEGLQTIYYKASYKESSDPLEQQTPTNAIEVSILPEPYQSSIQTLKDNAYAKSGNDGFFVLNVLGLLNSDNQDVALLTSKYAKTEIFSHLMNMTGIYATQIKGLMLENGRRNQQLIPLVKVYLNDNWQTINVDTSDLKHDLPILVWQDNSPSLLDLMGGKNSKVAFSISKNTRSALIEAKNNAINKANNFGLYSLPVSEQNVFKGILLLPIGALVVVFLRVIIGLKCSGTFMPILIATSFIQTELVNGLVGFVLIVSIGLVIRSYLSHLNLLLVSRISAVVIVVIGIIVASTVFAFRLGLTEALTITFFPMIIMAWTIERMSILWEEEGGKEVLIQGGGSLLVAVIAYLMMDSYLIRHWVFNFLGVHLLIMAAILLMGQYTGYRLLELRRFKPLADD